MNKKKKLPILLINEKKNYRTLKEYIRCYPRNTKEIYAIYPVQTNNSRYLEVRNFYPNKNYLDGTHYSPGFQGIQIMSTETLDVLIEELLRLRDFISKPKELEALFWPKGPIDFEVAENIFRSDSLPEKTSESGELSTEESNIRSV